jgi:nucleotide-binding universal stress UspA family protein
MIGFDCSKGATAAIDAVAHRNWDKNCEFQVVAVADPLSPSLIGQFIPPVARAVDEMNEAEYKWIETEAVRAIDTLAQAGYAASLKIFAGNAKHVLVEEAERWRAGCIFVGAHSYSSRAEKYLLGSTSAAVAARAHCSVEVVRI